MPEATDILSRAQELTDSLAASKDGTACTSLPQWPGGPQQLPSQGIWRTFFFPRFY